MSVSLLPSARGLGMARYALALCRGHGDLMQAALHAEARHEWSDTPNTRMALRDMVTGSKAAVTAGSTLDSDWAAPLSFAALARDFIAATRPLMAMDRLIPVMRRVPENTRVPRQNSVAVAAWVSQSVKKPATESSFDSVILPPLKVTALAVISLELANLTGGAAEDLVRSDLVGAVAKTIDSTFLSSAAAVADTSPPGIGFGVTPIASTGNGISDAAAAIAALTAGGSQLIAPYFVMHPGVMASIASDQVVPSVSTTGGSLLGFPVIVSSNVPSGQMLLIDASEVLLNDGTGMRLTVSTQAIVDLGNGTPISLYQQNLTGILVERSISWQPKRAPASTTSVVSGIT